MSLIDRFICALDLVWSASPAAAAVVFVVVAAYYIGSRSVYRATRKGKDDIPKKPIDLQNPNDLFESTSGSMILCVEFLGIFFLVVHLVYAYSGLTDVFPSGMRSFLNVLHICK